MSDTDTMGSLAAQDSYDPFAAEQFVPSVAADWVRQAAPQDVATLRTVAQPIMGALAAPGQALASTTPITSEQMIVPAAGIAGLTTLGAGAAPATANELRMGIKAYHGSPYDFDRFDLSKIGTGEGAQSYGHGLYFADKEGIARHYRDKLSGKELARPDAEAIAAIKPQWDEIVSQLRAERVRSNERPTSLSMDLQNKLDALNDHAISDTLSRNPWMEKGRMYEVNINADPAHFLDWDKQLSEQHPNVTKALDQIVKSRDRSPADWIKSSPGAEARMGEAGVPGIKYLDQGSRGLQDAAEVQRQIERVQATLAKDPGNATAKDLLGTYQQQLADAQKASRNYVVFNDQLINILRKYGLAGAAPAGIGALAAQDNYQQ